MVLWFYGWWLNAHWKKSGVFKTLEICVWDDQELKLVLVFILLINKLNKLRPIFILQCFWCILCNVARRECAILFKVWARKEGMQSEEYNWGSADWKKYALKWHLVEEIRYLQLLIITNVGLIQWASS